LAVLAQARNPKLETRNKTANPKTAKAKPVAGRVFFASFVIGICFGFRVSCFGFLRDGPGGMTGEDSSQFLEEHQFG
jgi:hypothetical protein